MNSRERRIDTRVNIKVPFRFRVLNNPGSPEQSAESINISQRGLLFATAIPLKVGTPLEVSLKMPRELAGQVSSDVHCVARVSTSNRMRSLGAKWKSDCTLKGTRHGPLREPGRAWVRVRKMSAGRASLFAVCSRPMAMAALPPQLPLAGTRTVALALVTFSN